MMARFKPYTISYGCNRGALPAMYSVACQTLNARNRLSVSSSESVMPPVASVVAIATSPAVGVFQPRPEARAGTRVRAGDRLGAVEMLGVPQDVVAPAAGIVGATLVESGQAVEYGQELVVIELAARAAERSEA
mgnify:CR=1 FL=1